MRAAGIAIAVIVAFVGTLLALVPALWLPLMVISGALNGDFWLTSIALFQSVCFGLIVFLGIRNCLTCLRFDEFYHFGLVTFLKNSALIVGLSLLPSVVGHIALEAGYV